MLKAGSMGGLIGANINMKLTYTPFRIYKEAERRGDKATMERAMGYTVDTAGRACENMEIADKALMEEQREENRCQELETEERIQNRREENKERKEEIEKTLKENTQESKPVASTPQDNVSDNGADSAGTKPEMAQTEESSAVEIPKNHKSPESVAGSNAAQGVTPAGELITLDIRV